MSDLLQDIDEALKREKAEKFWREHGPYLIGGLVLLVVLTGAFAAWNAWQTKANTQQTGLLLDALQTPFPQTALDAVSETLTGKHKALAQMQSAGLLAADGKNDDALTAYKDVSADGTAPATLRDLATLMAARLEWNKTQDEATAKTLSAQLKPLLSKNNPWRLQASLQAAIVTAEGLGDYKGALSLLGGILSAADAPPSLRARAAALDHLYAMKVAPATTTKTPAKAGTETESEG